MAVCSPKKCIQTVLCIAFVSFVVINVNFLSPSRLELSRPDDIDTIAPRKLRTTNLSGNSLILKKAEAPTKDDQPTKPILASKQEVPNVTTKKAVLDDSSAQRSAHFNESLRFIINDINRKQEIRNVDKFPPLPTYAYKHVLVIQVHNRDQYLRYLINSLRTTRYINSSLLIVSHDFYSKEVFEIIASIDFMPVSEPEIVFLLTLSYLESFLFCNRKWIVLVAVNLKRQ